MLIALIFAISSAQQPPMCATGGFVISPDSTVWICKGLETPPQQLQLGGGIPSGSILLIDSGTCPAGFTEVATLNGKNLLGTLAANGNIGTTGGSDNITPAGTNSALTFTGSPLATHFHELPFQLVSGTSVRHLPAATFGTGTSRAAQGVDTATANTTSAAVALSEAKSAGTPSGTINTPVFTGTQFDNRSAFVRVIFCKKD